MNSRYRSVARERAHFLRVLLVSTLSLLFAAGVFAAPQDIDLACSPAPADFTISASVGVASSTNIGVLNAGGNVFWDFVTTPGGCAGGPTSFTCNGVGISLPAGAPATPVPSSAVVAVSGTPTSSGAFSFRLVVTSNDGTSTCEREYDLILSAPYDIVFVLDHSGSMNGTTGIALPATDRWDALTIGVNGFTPFLQSSAPPNSRFGLTLFSTNVLPNPLPANLVTIGGTLASDVAAALGATPVGWTAMGSGLKDGMGKLTDATRPRVVVLFTDGEQNQPPEVLTTGCGYTDATLVNPTCPAGVGSVKIVTVGVGSPGGPDLTTLQNLAGQNRGTAMITANGSSFTGGCSGDITSAFTCAIAPALAGTSPQMVASFSGALSGTVSLPPFEVNRKVSQLLIQLSYTRKFETPSLVGLLSGIRILKDGTDVTSFFRPMIVGNFTNVVTFVTDFVLPHTVATTIPPEGTYTVEMTEPSNQPSLSFRALVFADDHRLDMDWQVSPGAPRVNQPLQPTMSLSWLSRPVTNATVRAVILKPGDDLGDLLARNELKVDPSSADDAGSPGHQKYLQLIANDPDFLAQLVPVEQQLDLTHQGDGEYSASYDPGDISGVYQVLYRVTANDPAFGDIERLAAQSVYVRFGDVDLEASEVRTTTSGNTLTINFRPMTTYGRFVGPAQGDGFSVTGTGVTLDSVTDNQDGSYTLVLSGDLDADISLDLLGESIYQGPASDIGGKGFSSWLLLLLLLVLLLLVWLARKIWGGSTP